MPEIAGAASWDVYPTPEAVIAQASQGQLGLLLRGMTPAVFHCVEEVEMGEE